VKKNIPSEKRRRTILEGAKERWWYVDRNELGAYVKRRTCMKKEHMDISRKIKKVSLLILK